MDETVTMKQGTSEAASNMEVGTFDFCSSCPTKSNCCTRIRDFGAIEPPFLFASEIARISKVASGGMTSIQTRSLETGEQIWMLRSNNPGCVFHVNGRCSIYNMRPVDCRLFPFDIRERADGKLVWVVYTKLCPKAFDYSKYFEAAKILLSKLVPNVDEVRRFARHGRAKMYSQDALEIEEFSI